MDDDDAYDDVVDDFLAELTVVKVKLVYLVHNIDPTNQTYSHVSPVFKIIFQREKIFFLIPVRDSSAPSNQFSRHSEYSR